jgi:uncharacterized membrane protein YraQ (UPF0718 family)
VPLFIGFVEARIPLGIAFVFLIVSPVINGVAVVLLIGILGWEITRLYVLPGVVVTYVGSGSSSGLSRRSGWESYVWDIKIRQQQEQQA